MEQPKLEFHPPDDRPIEEVFQYPIRQPYANDGTLVVRLIPRKEFPYVDDCITTFPNGQDHCQLDISLHCFNYFARLVEYLGPKSKHFMNEYGDILKGGPFAHRWIMFQYADASITINQYPVVMYQTVFRVELSWQGFSYRGVPFTYEYRLRIDPDVESPIEFHKPSTNDDNSNWDEVQFPLAFYNKVRYFVNRHFPDVKEGELIKAITVLFNSSTYFMYHGAFADDDEHVRERFGEVEESLKTFPSIERFPYNWGGPPYDDMEMEELRTTNRRMEMLHERLNFNQAVAMNGNG